MTQHPELAHALGVMATSTTLQIRDGRVLGVHVGGLGPAWIEGLVSQ